MIETGKEDALAYGSKSFARSFEHRGDIVTLPHSGIRLLKRPIDKGLFDLAGVYPFVVSSNWDQLAKDEDYIDSLGAVSMVFVTDPLDEAEALRAVQEWSVWRRYKKHYNINLTENWQNDLHRKTRWLIRKSSEYHDIREITPSDYWVDQFWLLYQNLIERHSISGTSLLTFSMLKQQLKTPGTYISAAMHYEEVLSMMILFIRDEKAYLYLHASSDEAYRFNTNYALYYQTYENLRKRGIKLINLGGNAGLSNDDDDGLSRFKRKWSKDERYSLLCGKILNRDLYNMLSKGRKDSGDYFPAYRFNH